MADEIIIKEVYVSIVTLPKLTELEIGSETYNRFKSTYTDYKEYLNDKQVVQSYLDDAGKSIAFNRIYQIALGFEIEDTIRITVLNGEESDILREFHNLLTSYFKEAKLYGYNNEFIYDVLNFRGRVNKVPLELEAPQHKDVKNQVWKQTKSICLMNETVSSYRGKISLLNALYGAELDYKDIIPGEDIFTYFQSNKFDDIDNSSAATIKGLINLKRFLENKDELSEFNLKVQQVGKVEKQTINVLDHLLASGELSSKVLKVLSDYADNNDRPRKDIFTLCVAALSKTKEYNKVPEDDIQMLKEALKLTVDYSKIQCVLDKKNLQKKQANEIINLYKKSSIEEKKEVVNLVEQYLIEFNKISQKTAKESLQFLKHNLLSYDK